MSRNSLLEAGAKSEGEVPASSKEFLDIQATIECGFTLKRVRDMIKTYSVIKRIASNKTKYLKFKRN